MQTQVLLTLGPDSGPLLYADSHYLHIVVNLFIMYESQLIIY